MWLWWRPAVTAPVGLLAWELPYSEALKRRKKKKKRSRYRVFFWVMKMSRNQTVVMINSQNIVNVLNAPKLYFFFFFWYA